MDTSALVVVHLASLDAYATECSIGAAYDLSGALCAAIAEHPGKVVVLSGADWPPNHRESRPRREVLATIAARGDVIWFQHDDDTRGWSRPMKKLAHLLRNRGITDITLAGVWYRLDETSGCVTSVKHALAVRGFTCRVDTSLVALLEDIDADDDD